jgi:hypothetical protein
MWPEDFTEWSGFFRQFTVLWALYLWVPEGVPLIAYVIGTLEGERATEVLPALRTIGICYPGQASGARSETLRLLGPFLAAREETEHPVVVDFVYSTTSRI